MKPTISKVISRLALLASLVCSLVLASYAAPQDSAAKTAAVAQETFATPQAAVDALLKAAAADDVPALLKMFGQDQQDLFTTADPVKDKNTLLSFVELANKKTKISTDPAKPNVATIVVGENDWPMPIPLVKRNGKWIFDTKAGHNEILYRRIGSNELDAIAICHNYVAAQLAYSATRHDGAIVNQYAQKIISTPGKQDGLYWKNADGSDGGPLSEGIAKAIEEGYSVEKPTAYHGYYFKILKGQGPAAPIGRIDYVIQGAMIGGFALVAYPAQYRVTGVKTFIVSQDGVVYQKDLGPDTLTTARQMELYNPDKTWQPTEDSWPDTSDTTATASN